jgi:hypothetical protein
MDEQLYDIVRFRFSGGTEVVKRNVTREEAEEHCQDDSTHGDGWFDGFGEAGWQG